MKSNLIQRRHKSLVFSYHLLSSLVTVLDLLWPFPSRPQRSLNLTWGSCPGRYLITFKYSTYNEHGLDNYPHETPKLQLIQLLCLRALNLKLFEAPKGLHFKQMYKWLSISPQSSAGNTVLPDRFHKVPWMKVIKEMGRYVTQYSSVSKLHQIGCKDAM